MSVFAKFRLGGIADRVLLAGILVIAAAMRLTDLETPDVWIDEANLILISKSSLPELFEKLRLDSSPPLYYLIVHFWAAVFGDSPFALRFLSVLGGMGLVLAVYWVSRDLISPATGLWSALYIAVSPSQSFFSQQVRMYALIGLLALLSVAGLVRFCRDGKSRDFALWVGASLLSLYNHNFAFHLGIAHAVLIASSGQLVSRRRSWLLAAVIVAVVYAPWVPTLLDQLNNQDHYSWFLRLWETWGGPETVLRSLRSFSPGGEMLASYAIGSIKFRGLPTYMACSVAALGVWVAIGRLREVEAPTALWPLVLFLVPIASSLALSYAITPHFVPGRVDQMMLPGFAVLVGIGMTRIRPVWIRAALGIGLVVVGGWAKFSMYDLYFKGPFEGADRALSDAIIENWQPDDVIVTTSLSRASLTYYLQRAEIDARFLSYPRSSIHLGAQNDERLLENKKELAHEAEGTLAEARAMAGPKGRVFVVWVNRLVNYPLRRGALDIVGYRELAYFGRFRQFGTANQMEVVLYQPGGAPEWQMHRFN